MQTSKASAPVSMTTSNRGPRVPGTPSPASKVSGVSTHAWRRRSRNVLQGPSISKRSQLTSDATAVVLYKRATSPKELDNARTTALWTAVVSIIGLIGAVIALIVGPLLLGVTLGATGLVLTGVGIIASILAINTNLAVYRKLGQAQKDIQGRQDISNTTVIVPPKPWFCPAFPIFQSCQ